MNYNSPLMKMLDTIANLLIVNFFCVLTSLPIVTIIPSFTAMYHTIAKNIYGPARGRGVIKDYFDSFKINFKTGVILNMIYIVAAFFIIVGLDTGIQIYKINVFGLLYLILGIIITFMALTMLIHIPAVSSRLILRVVDIFRLSAYMGLLNPLVSLIQILLLVFFYYLVQIIPLSIVVAPAVFIDLIRPNMEKKLNSFITENHLDDLVVEETKEEEKQEEISNIDIDKELSKKRKKGH